MIVMRTPGLRAEGGRLGPLPACPISPLVPHLLHQVDKAASGLLSIGLCKGDRLGMWGPNSYAWVLIQLATAQAGIILVRRGLLGTAGCAWGNIIQGESLRPSAPRTKPVPDWFQTRLCFLLRPTKEASGSQGV